MNAREITMALGGSWHGSYGMAMCPCHDDGNAPGLKITDDDRKNDGIDLHCFAGCDWREVKAELRERDLLAEFSGSTSSSNRTCRHRETKPNPLPSKGGADDDDTRQRVAQAGEIWRRSEPATGTKVETYLRTRAITLPPPPSIRFHSDLTYGPIGTGFPAMVAAVQRLDRSISAIHRTFLLPDGSAKANVGSPKMALGPLGSGAVRLAKTGPVLGLAEGIETALSAMQLFDVPCWVALGSRLDRVALPESVRHVVIFADNGDAGREAAGKAVEAFNSRGLKVTLRQPPETFGDWNDALVALEKERQL